MALLNSESMGRRMIGLVDGLIVARGGGAPPLSIFEGRQFGNRFAVEGLGILGGEHRGRDARWRGDQIKWGIGARVARRPPQITGGEVRALSVDCHFVLVGCLIILGGHGGIACPLCASLEFAHHLYHLPIIDTGRIPFDAIGGLAQAASDLSLSHTANELLPRGLIIATVLNTRLSGIVQKLIVANPEGGIPGFVVGPAVVVVLHGSGRLVDGFILDGQGSPATIPCGSLPTVPLHAAAVDLLIIEAIIEIEIEDLAWHVLNLGEQGVGFHGLVRLVDGFILQGAQFIQAARCASSSAVSSRLSAFRSARQDARSASSTQSRSPFISAAISAARARHWSLRSFSFML